MWLLGRLGTISEEKAAQMAPLALAYVGDSVYDIYVRTKLVSEHDCGAGALHSMSVGVVNAKAQADFARFVKDDLTGREKDVFRRGRNTKSITIPKNMSAADYCYATAIEAVMGYLYLSGQHERLSDLLSGVMITDPQG